jgi:ribose/xylose/arabinose/galactoside ABC-type transport system permease subunit
MHRISWPPLVGAIAGVGATVVMSAAMLAARRAGLTGMLPPERIAEAAIEETTDRPAGAEERTLVASVTHLGFGAAAGAVFGVIRHATGIRGPVASVAGALLFANLVYVTSYQGWVPALRIMPPASRDDTGRVGTMVVAHWIYGAVLGALAWVLGRR